MPQRTTPDHQRSRWVALSSPSPSLSRASSWPSPALSARSFSRGFEKRPGERASLRDHLDTQIGNLRDRMESQNSDLRDRLGRIEGYLDLLREFFVGSGRGTAA